MPEVYRRDEEWIGEVADAVKSRFGPFAYAKSKEFGEWNKGLFNLIRLWRRVNPDWNNTKKCDETKFDEWAEKEAIENDLIGRAKIIVM
jgi:hypothetical protein